MEALLRNGYSGGEEIRRAAAALAGPASIRSKPKPIGEEEMSGPFAVPLPIQLEDNTDPAIRELAYAAQKYGRLAAVDPSDSDAIYNHGLALQELALRASTSRTDQEKLLQQASRLANLLLRIMTKAAGRYKLAWKLQPRSHAALYNWGVALSDLARVVKSAQKDGALEYLEQAGDKYEMSLRLHPHNPQALNNWGLVLQELSNSRPPADQANLVGQSIARFRSALRLRPEFDRAWYNLGTVFYAFACSQQASISQRLPSSITQDPEQEQLEQRDTEASQISFQLAAQYILFAHSLQPNKDVYKKSLGVVLPLMPRPYVRTGKLWAAESSSNGCEERWLCREYVLDDKRFGLREEASSDGSSPQSLELASINGAVRAKDPSLHPGYAFWVGLRSKTSGQFFVAEKLEESEGWVDAILLCSHLASTKRLSALSSALVQDPVPQIRPTQSRPRTASQ